MKTLSIAALGVLFSSSSALKVAFVGDTGAQTTGTNGYYGKAVYDLIKQEGAQVVMQNGDLDYRDDPTLWSQFLSTNAVGVEVVHTSGNHEDLGSHQGWLAQNGYKAQLSASVGANGQNCLPRTGRTLAQDYGEYMSCTIENSIFVMIGWKQLEDKATSAAFLRERLSGSSQPFKFCVWHRPEGTLNPGNKHVSNYRTQELYNICREYGAVVTSGHSHVYGRTKLISDYTGTPQVSAQDSPNPTIACGTSLSFVVGMGGFKFDSDGPYANEQYFQKKYTSNDAPGDRAGALFCDTGSGKSTRMDCYFKLAEVGDIIDQFSVVMDTAACTNSQNNNGTPPNGSGNPAGSDDTLVYVGAGVAAVGVGALLVAAKKQQTGTQQASNSIYSPSASQLNPSSQGLSPHQSPYHPSNRV